VTRAVRPTWRQVVAEASARLGSALEARRIAERASGTEGAEWLLDLDDPVAERILPFFEGMVERRAAGEPLQYVTGRWAFRRLDLYLDRRVLIPRPETEMVVQVALGEVAPLGKHPVIVDLGTGSGAIALSMAVEVPTAEVWATERSPGAAAVARANLAGVGTLVASRVRVLEGSWFDPLPPLMQGRVQLVVSNPPYVADADQLPDEVADWEPTEALRAGPTGLEAIAEIVGQAPAWLARPGALVVEIAPHQAADATRLAWDAGFLDVEVRLDLAGHQRTLLARA
jgi:release factor glutamine methyltransferase